MAGRGLNICALAGASVFALAPAAFAQADPSRQSQTTVATPNADGAPAANVFPASPAPAATAPRRPVRTRPAPSRRPDDTRSGDEAADAVDATRSTTVSELTVTAKRPPPQYGAVVGDIKPELQLGPAEVQSYGVSTVTELLDELAPETRSDRGRGASTPVVLLNGRRISSLAEVQNIPVEAILRVDILPEEVSLKYGYTADQRVVNIVLRRRFRAVTVEGMAGEATEGGDVNSKVEADLIAIRRNQRLNVDLKFTSNSQITDADRGIVEPPAAAPYSQIGNIVSPSPGAQIDPALSALAGGPVTVAGAPAGLSGTPTLASFLPSAGQANAADVADYRTLQSQSENLTLNAVMAKDLPWGVNLTVNGTLGASRSAGLQGLPAYSLAIPAGDPFSPFSQPVIDERYGATPLHQYAYGWTGHLGTTLNKDVKSWRLSLTDAYDHADTQTDTDEGLDPGAAQALLDNLSPSFNPFGPAPASLVASRPQDYARAISDSANIQFLANGPIVELPAGPLYFSGKAGDAVSRQDSLSATAAGERALSLSRNDLNAQGSVDLPIADRDKHVLGFVGDLSLNANAAFDQVSDFGTLATLGGGVNWTPHPGWNLIVSETHDHAAPSISQLGAPTIATPGIPAFDYVTGQSVTVTVLNGGNPQLKADTRNVMKVGLTLKPFPKENLTIQANYIRSRIDNPIETFPALTAGIQQAFASRFVRDAAGSLEQVDETPVNFAQADRSELRWGINYWRPIGPQPKPRFGFRQRRGPGSGEGGGGGGGSRGGGFGGGRGGRGFGGYAVDGPTPGRFQVAVYHTILFTDSLLVRPGGPTLDLLNGAPAGSTGGQPRHEVEAQLGFTYKTYGARLSADWKSATYVQGGAMSPTGALYFSDIGTVNLRLFDNLGQARSLTRRYPELKGVRLTLALTNIADTRMTVRDAAGGTPLAYQGGYLDPVGRTISLSLRKVFY